MNYELCKQLKNAGFPQKPKTDYPLYITEVNEEPMQVPTLSELIEACGVIDCEIINDREDERYFVRFPGSDDGNGNEHEYCLPTLEEVFAYHWLELNKK